MSAVPTNPDLVIKIDWSFNEIQALKRRVSALGGGTGTGDALTSQPLSQFASTTSAQLAAVISNKTGGGVLVFGTNPTLTGVTIADGSSIGIGATTGTSIGDGSSKIGFYGTAGIMQPSGNIGTALQTLGLVSSPTGTVTVGQASLSSGQTSVTTAAFSGAAKVFLTPATLSNASSTIFYTYAAGVPGAFTIKAIQSNGTSIATSDTSTINWLIST